MLCTENKKNINMILFFLGIYIVSENELNMTLNKGEKNVIK